MERAGHPESPASPWSVALWWVATLLVLVVLDDLTFGPLFWFVSVVIGPGWAVAAVYCTYVPIQMFLVYRGTEEVPGRIAGWWLHRLSLERRSVRIQRNVERVHGNVTGAVAAVPLSTVIGGVLPPLILWRRGWERRFVRAVAWPCAITYASVFALIHGLLPAAI